MSMQLNFKKTFTNMYSYMYIHVCVVDFSKWRLQRRKSTSGFQFGNGTQKLVKSTYRPNFDDPRLTTTLTL